MSAASTAVVASSSKAEKSKKFQSLNINNLYQGSTNKPLQRSAPQKHGLQSLGKVPTARRAPANLPSLKAENYSNDGGAVLSPNGGSTGGTGQAVVGMGNVGASAGGGGWAGGKDELNYGVAKSLQLHLDGGLGGVGIVDKKRIAIDGDIANVAGSNQEKSSWGGGVKVVSSKTDPKSKSFLNQRSALFGQEFPSLGDGGSASIGDDTGNSIGITGAIQSVSLTVPPNGFSSVAAAALTTSVGQAGGAADAKYGPGPSLRPQTSGNWLHGGVAKIENGGAPPNSAVGMSSGGDGPSSAIGSSGGGGGGGMSGSSRLVDAFLHKPPPSSTLPAPVMPQFDVSLNGPQAAPPPMQGFIKKLPSSRSGGGGSGRGGSGGSSGIPLTSGGPKRSRAGTAAQGVGNSGHLSQHQKERDKEMQTFKEHSIIDDEKLKRMDILEVTEDDWTRNDDNFDYNKKLKRYVRMHRRPKECLSGVRVDHHPDASPGNSDVIKIGEHIKLCADQF